jgi:hypothetical protein
VKDFRLNVEDKVNLTQPDGARIADIPVLKDGAIIGVQELVKRGDSKPEPH